MIRFRTPLSLLAAAGFIVATASAPGQAPESRAYLLNVSRMQTFTAIGSEDKTKVELVEDFTELAGNALKVAFSKGDSAGDRVAKVKNWKPFDTLRFNVFSPGKDTVKLGLNVFHARSTNYQTRIEVPVVLKPGKNEVSIGIHELRNTNGSAPALADIRRWYFADADGKGPTVYFGDMVLERTVAPVEVRGDPARLCASVPPRCPGLTSRSCSTRRRPTPSCLRWKCSHPTMRGTWSSRTGRCIPTRRTSSSRSARTKTALQHRHGLRPGAARPEEDRRSARLGRRRVGEGPVPGAGQHADRRLPDQLQRPDAG